MQPSINIISENENFLILNKPPLMHSTGDNSVQSFLQHTRADFSSLPESGMVQRLDFETSGALHIAKNSAAIGIWKDAYANGEITKEYLLLVSGKLSHETIVEGFFGNRYRGSTKVSFSEKEKKRFMYAKTSFRSIASASEYSVLLATTQHGRRHQVRVSAAQIGLPLVGDELYGGESVDHSFVLHASRVQYKGESVVAPVFEVTKGILDRYLLGGVCK